MLTMIEKDKTLPKIKRVTNIHHRITKPTRHHHPPPFKRTPNNQYKTIINHLTTQVTTKNHNPTVIT